MLLLTIEGGSQSRTVPAVLSRRPILELLTQYAHKAICTPRAISARLIEEDQGGYRLAVELYAQLPGIDPKQAQRIMDEAHKTCPYSKALSGEGGDTSVKLMVD